MTTPANETGSARIAEMSAGYQYARAQAAESKLGAVSEVLKEKLPESIQWGEAYWYRALEVDERNRRLRSIVEGK